MAVAGRTVAERRPSKGRLASRLRKRCAKIAEDMPSTAVARRCGARVGLSWMWAGAGTLTPGGRGQARTTSRARRRINGNDSVFRPCDHQSTTLSHRCAKGGHRKSGGGSKTPPSDTCPDLAWKKSGESCGGPCSVAAVRRRPAMPDRDHNPHYTQDMVWQECDVKRPPKLGGVFEN